MAIGERIRFFRNLRGMTQKYLGMQVGFPEKTADIRMAQYESGSRTPKADLTNSLAEVFGVSTSALTVPDIDSYNGLMHTLFTLEDSICFPLGRSKPKNLRTEKSQKRNTTVGVITILQSILNKGVTYENTN